MIEKDKPKGNAMLRWTYARWIQLIAHGDLLGADGKPSQGKLAAATAMTYGLITTDSIVVILALCAAFGRGTLLEGIRSWRGVSRVTTERTKKTVEIDTTKTVDVKQTIDVTHRNIVEDPAGDYEPTP